MDYFCAASVKFKNRAKKSNLYEIEYGYPIAI